MIMCCLCQHLDMRIHAGFTISFREGAPIAVLVVFIVLWVGAVMTLQMLPVVWRPTKFAVPLSPLTPALGMAFTLHLIGETCKQTSALDPASTSSETVTLNTVRISTLEALRWSHLSSRQIAACREPWVAGICPLWRVAGDQRAGVPLLWHAQSRSP